MISHDRDSLILAYHASSGNRALHPPSRAQGAPSPRVITPKLLPSLLILVETLVPRKRVQEQNESLQKKKPRKKKNQIDNIGDEIMEKVQHNIVSVNTIPAPDSRPRSDQIPIPVGQHLSSDKSPAQESSAVSLRPTAKTPRGYGNRPTTGLTGLSGGT